MGSTSSFISQATAQAGIKMLTLHFFVLACLLPLSSALHKNQLEKLRLLHGHDGIDTATVHITYPHSPHLKRLTKREALSNLKGLPDRPQKFIVKVTLKSTGHVLDLQLEPSKLEVTGALVTEMREGGSEQFHVQDEKCHYQGVFDDNKGMASVHFCDGVLVGGAHNGLTEYNFHSHHHPILDHPDNDDTSTPSTADQGHLYHTIVSWRNASQDFAPGGPVRVPGGILEAVEVTKRYRRDVDSDSEEEEDELNDNGPVAVSDDDDDSDDPDVNTAEVPIVEFGVLFDEDFLRDRKHIYPTRRDLIHFLFYKYTGVQALYGNPEVTGFNMKIQLKLIYLWYKNPSWYPGSAIPIGQRMGAGNNFSKINADYRRVDVGAIYTSQAPGVVEGMGFVGGACIKRGKTFVTRGWDLNWITESHEFGHTLGLPHDCAGNDTKPPWNQGFMNSYQHRFLPCVKDILERRMKLKRWKCFFQKNLNITNIPFVRLEATWPILAYGYNYHCRTYFRRDSTFVFEENKPCGAVMCAVMDAKNKDNGMAQFTRDIDASLFGRSCGPNGMICLNRECQSPINVTTITARDTMTGTGTWGEWSGYADTCTSACGVGVRVSSRTCSNKARAEACANKGVRYRAKLCNTHPCPGDELRDEVGLRTDRENYTCSLLKARGGPYSKYLDSGAYPVAKKDLMRSINILSCMADCRVLPRNSSLPPLQRKHFGYVLQVNGALCGPVNVYDRRVLGVTTRCLYGRCIEFGCDGYSMESRREGKVKDLCGVCGGDNSTCTTGHRAVSVAGDQRITVVVLPAGTKDIQFAVKSDDNVKLALTNKEDDFVIVPGQRGRFKISNNEDNPLNFAGTHWTTVENEILTAPGPLDQPMKIKVQLVRSGSANAVVVWGYKPPSTVPPPPTCLNNGTANYDLGGCICGLQNTHGKQCEFRCGFDMCYNRGEMFMERRCKCNCTDTLRTNPSARCACREGFAGPDCNQCAIRHCYNGGVRNATSCGCDCPPGCDGKPDCSDCNFNPLLPDYRGQYGRGSLEQVMKDVTGGQSTVRGRAGFVSMVLVAVWFLLKLSGVHIL